MGRGGGHVFGRVRIAHNGDVVHRLHRVRLGLVQRSREPRMGRHIPPHPTHPRAPHSPSRLPPPPARLVLLRAADDVDLALDEDTVEPIVVHEVGGLGALVWVQTEHGGEEGGDGVGFVLWEEIFVVEDAVEGPVAEFVDVAEFTCVGGGGG